MTSRDLQKMEPWQVAKYIEDQMDLFRKKGHSPTLALTHELVKRKDGYYHLVKRDKAIEVLDWDLDGRGCQIALHEKMRYENFFGEKKTEEDKLFLMGHDVCTVEVGEIQEMEEFNG